jgi:probable rRNA maturation factor
MPGYDISIEVDAPGVDPAALGSLAHAVMAGEVVAEGTALAVRLVDDDEIRALNRQFLGVDEPTDVLSFPDAGDEEFIVGEPGTPSLGDIAISLPTAERQANEAGHSLASELAHLLVHGILHLCGYDHVTGPEDEARMRAREEYYLGDLGAVHRHGS